MRRRRLYILSSRKILPGFVWMIVFLTVGVGDLHSFVQLHGSTGPAPQGLTVEYHDRNQVRLAISNVGLIGYDVISGNAGGFWPRYTNNNYIFASGLWLSALGDIDADGVDDTLFLQACDPFAWGSEFREGKYGQSPDDPLATVFKSTDPDDLEHWPKEYQILDDDPWSPTYGRLIPLVMSDQDMVTIYNSVEGTPHFSMPNPPVEVRQRSLAFRNGLSAQAILFFFDIENISDQVPDVEPFTLEDAWIGFFVDADIGDHFADERTSFFRWQVTPMGDSIPINMGYAWDEDFDESNFTTTPGFVGIAYIQSPGNDQDGIDNDFDGMIDESHFNGIDDDGDGIIDDMPDEVDQMGLVNYSITHSPGTGDVRPDPESDAEGYRIMSCDPPEECIETTEAHHIRFMISSGPTRLLPGETHRVVLAILFADISGEPPVIVVPPDPPRPDPNDPIFEEFLAVKKTLQGIYDLGFIKASPPPRPDITLLPGDGQVTVLWNDGPVFTPDPTFEEFVQLDPHYRQYDFEGFRLWRSRTGKYSWAGDPDDPLNPIASAINDENPEYDLTLLGQWDLQNGITTLPEGIDVLETIVDGKGDLIVIRSDTLTLGEDTGLRFSFIDRGDPGVPLINGYKYNYCIESYDYNSTSLPLSALSTHNGLSFQSDNTAMPRSNASSFIQAAGTLLHVDEDGIILDDETPDDILPLEEFLNESPGATDALSGFSLHVLADNSVEDTNHEFIVDDIVPEWSNDAKVKYHVEDANGQNLYTGGETQSMFTILYDSTSIPVTVTVFDPSDTTVPLYEMDLEFFGNADWYHAPGLEAFGAIDSDGNDVTSTLGDLDIPPGQFDPLGFRGTDITMEWREAGADTMTLSVYDQGNRVTVPVVEEENPRGMNWEFDPFGGQPGGALLIGEPEMYRLYISGSMISVLSPERFPEAGDVWTLKQRSFSEDITDTIITGQDTLITEYLKPAARPLVPGVRYRVNLTGGGQDWGEIDLTSIRVVPNPYLGAASFEGASSPFDRPGGRIQFINLPPECTIRLYTISGNLVRVLEHTPDEAGTKDYDLRTREGFKLASGNYYYHVTTPDGQSHLGRFAIVQ